MNPSNRFLARIRSTGRSSEKFGPCEVCLEPAPEVFLGSARRAYRRDDKTIGWTYAGGIDHVFGHGHCVRSRILRHVERAGGVLVDETERSG